MSERATPPRANSATMASAASVYPGLRSLRTIATPAAWTTPTQHSMHTKHAINLSKVRVTESTQFSNRKVTIARRSK